jgi:hypothetical protein
LRGRAEEQVVLGVALVGLQQVVIDVLHADLGARPVQPNASNSNITSVPVASWVRV